MLSTTASYALQAVLFLAGRPSDEQVSVDEISTSLDLPRNYLAKILHEMTRQGVVKSTRGKGGGFRLAVPREELTVLQVVGRIDRIDESRRCFLGRPECSDHSPCVAHDRWKVLADELVTFFSETTVADLLGTPSASR
jgi:Rrf2 family iron-sulfur cluster assembly transcriptional regulator